jgi:serine/threonine protein phosphatase PrpC
MALVLARPTSGALMADQLEAWSQSYLTALFKQHGITLAPSHKGLFNDFAKSEELRRLLTSLIKIQKDMLAAWKIRVALDEVKSATISLPNATVGKSYSHALVLPNGIADHIERFEIHCPGEIGFEFDAANKALSGVPKSAGEFKLTMRYHINGAPESEPHERDIRLFVNADPRSLWKNLDSDRTDPHWKEDDVASYDMAFPGRKLIAASKRGRSHAHEGLFRDDDYSFRYWPETGWGLLSIADGAGSCALSRRGSLLACSAVLEFFESPEGHEALLTCNELLAASHAAPEQPATDQAGNEPLDATAALNALVVKAAKHAHDRIAQEALQQGKALKDYSTTLLYALVKEMHGQTIVASFWIGDGGVAAFDQRAAAVHQLSSPDSGEFAGQTRFLTSPDTFLTEGRSRSQVAILEGYTALLLMTDGVTDPKFQTDANLGRYTYWDQLWKDLSNGDADVPGVEWSAPPEVASQQLLKWLDFWSPGNHDDRTIMILY